MFGQNHSARLHHWTTERLSEYIDNRLTPHERARIEQHLAECAACRASLGSLRWTVALVKQVPAPALPRTFVLPVPAPRAQPSLALGLAQFGAVLATVLLLAVIGLEVLVQSSGALRAPMPSLAYESAAPTLEIAAAPLTPAPQATPWREAPRTAIPTATPQSTPALPAAVAVAPLPTATPESKRATADQTLSATTVPRVGIALVATTPTATSTPTPTATSVPPTATAFPSPTLVAQVREDTRAPQPTTPAYAVAPFDMNVLRALQMILLALAVFFSALVFVLWRTRR